MSISKAFELYSEEVEPNSTVFEHHPTAVERHSTFAERHPTAVERHSIGVEYRSIASEYDSTAIESYSKRFEDYPKLGIGLGFREQFRADIFLNQSKIDFLEITSDHYLDAAPKKLEELKLLKEHFPLIPHSLELSLGSAEGIDEDYLEKVAGLVEFVEPAWFSDHLCFTKSNGIKIGHLAPVPFTNEALKVFVRNISKVKNRIKTPLILENITYMMRFQTSEMSEGAFIGKILEDTDCGLLLDVTNLYINSRNHGFNWREFLDELPLERVVQLHFVGLNEHQNLLIDAHANQTQSEIWEVFREVCARCDVKGAILERDENFPPFAEILEELKTARNLAEKSNLAKVSGV